MERVCPVHSNDNDAAEEDAKEGVDGDVKGHNKRI